MRNAQRAHTAGVAAVVALCSDAGADRALPLRLALATLDRTERQSSQIVS